MNAGPSFLQFRARRIGSLPGRHRTLWRRALVGICAGAVLATTALVAPQRAPAAQDTADPGPILTGPAAPAKLVTTPGVTFGHRDSFVRGPGSISPRPKGTATPGQARLVLDGVAATAGTTRLQLRTPRDTPATHQNRKAPTAIPVTAAVAPEGAGGLTITVTPTPTSTQTGRSAPSSLPAELSVDASNLPTSGDGLARLVAVRTSGTEAGATSSTVAVTVADQGRTVRVPVDLASASIVTLTTGTAGSSGDYSATELAPASTWDGGGETGAFTWSYPVATPASAGGLNPDLTIGYSSTSVDGRVASTNNQPSWLGEGFTLDPGHIDRAFASCRDDMTGGSNAARKTGDLCWKNDNASITLGGSATRLVKDASTGVWRLQDDDNSKVEHLTGASNGDQGTSGVDGAGEYWRVTTTNGTQYYFGKGSTTAGVTNSTWTVPVAGNHPGEPCYTATFASAFCNQAWRWNLDYVVDAHGNSMTYTYAKETNRYGQNLDTASVPYDRGGYLTQIDYGQRAGAETTSNASARVVFTVAERCLPGGTVTCDPAQLTAANQTYWPDVPFDLICTSSTSCGTTRTSPAFFTRKRLTAITTRVLSAGALVDVAKTSLTQSFPPPGDGMSAALFLDKLQATGYAAGGTTSLPTIDFGKTQMMNRVDNNNDGALEMYKYRVSSISTETGATITATYLGEDCVAGTSMPAAADSNTRRCFPMYWTRDGATTPTVGWFHTYPVASISEDAGVAGSRPTMTRYTYGGGMAWHYDSNPVAPSDRRTWSENRGFAKVTTTVGDTNEPKPLISSATFLRGMHGDKLAAGGSKAVTVTASTGVAVTDLNQYRGHVLEQVTYNGTPSASTEVTGTVNTPWTSAATATDALGSAYLTDVAKTSTRTTISGGAKRTTETTTTFTSDGYPTQVSDAGDIAVVDTDDRCTTIAYAPANTALNLRGLVSSVKTVALKCGAGYDARTQTLSDTRTYYDGATSLSTTPSKGDPTRTESLIEDGTTATKYVPVSQATYDPIGRALTSTDAMGKVTKSAYTPSDHTPTTSVTVTNPLGHAVTTAINPRLAQPTSVTDANGIVTTLGYDNLARRTKVWTGSRASSLLPNLEFGYTVSKTAPEAVTTKTLQTAGTAQTASTVLYDALLRPLQTQTPIVYDTLVGNPPKVGRALSDVIYDSRGLAIVNRGPWPDTATAPGTSYVSKQDQDLPAVTKTTYDGAGRATTSSLYAYNALKYSSSIVYNGDSTDVLPPAGASATRTIVDARGRTTELRQYKGNTITTTTGSWATTKYTVNNKDQLTRLTDADGAAWSYGYDLLGRRIDTRDPDSGHSTSSYNLDGTLKTTTDGTGKTLTHDYDALARPTALWDGASGTGIKLTAWAYDTASNGKGRLAKSSRYVGGNEYATTIPGYTPDGQPTGRTTVIPAAETGLAGTYTWTHSYYPNGQLEYSILPSVAGAGGASYTYGYDQTGRPMFLSGGATIVSAVSRDEYGALRHYQQSATSGVGVIVNQVYEAGTHRLTTLRMDRPNVTTPEINTSYTYNAAGQLTSAADVPDPANPSRTDRQCFQYDPLGRLKEAWSNGATSCAATPSYIASGAAPYWTSWTHTDGNRRTSETVHAPLATNNTVATYTYPAVTASAPTPVHGPSKVTRKVGTATAVEHALTYDNAGRTRTSPLDWSTASLTYDAEGRLKSVTRAGKTSPANVYDADGNLLVKGEVNGTKTLMLGDTQVTYTPSTGAKTTRRLYSFDGQIVAIRTGTGIAGLYYTPPGPQGSAAQQVNASTQAVSKRYYTPYGDDRKSFTGWQSLGGFLAATGATTDVLSNLTHLGARDYDPNLGRFLTPDPLLAPSDPSQLPAYQYGGNDPLNHSDPTGLMRVSDGGGQQSPWERDLDVKRHTAVAATLSQQAIAQKRQLVSVPLPKPPTPPAAKQIRPPGGHGYGYQIPNQSAVCNCTYSYDLSTAYAHTQEIPTWMKVSGAVLAVAAVVIANPAIGFAVYAATADAFAGGSLLGGTAVSIGATVGTRALITAERTAANSAARTGLPRDALGRFTSTAGGESAATAAGRSAHTNYANTLGGGNYVFNRALPGSRLRPDAVDYSQNIVRELKPDTPGAISGGWRQVNQYKAYLEELTGQPWTAYVDVYTP
jgi:RHS repeat-associated protein